MARKLCSAYTRGVFIERGIYDELLAVDGFYAEFYHSQWAQSEYRMLHGFMPASKLPEDGNVFADASAVVKHHTLYQAF